MCTDFIDLNKACPKDAYPLPNIDSLVDGVSRCELMTLIDSYSRYNQLRMHLKDEDKMVFGNFCYTVMPFGLKNGRGRTYQRLMNRVLEGMIGRIVEAYVDEMLVASDHVEDLRELFQALDKYKLKLNPKKMYFWCKGRKILGIHVDSKGI